MAIFDFIKEAGEALIHGHGGQASSSSSPQPAASNVENPTGQQLEERPIGYLRSLNLGIENPQVKVEGDRAGIQGKASSQEAMEKAVLAVGNTAGIATVDSKIDAPVNVNKPKFVTVKSGDTLSKIAKEALGDAAKYKAIFEANKPMLTSPDRIYPGQALRIPQEAQKAA